MPETHPRLLLTLVAGFLLPLVASESSGEISDEAVDRALQDVELEAGQIERPAGAQ